MTKTDSLAYTPEQRYQMILDFVKREPASTNMVAHGVWRDWTGPPGNGSHPLVRVTGKMLHTLEEKGKVHCEWDSKRGKYIWHATA